MRKFLFFALVAIGMVACHAENETVSRTTLPEEVGIEVADASPMGATRSYEEALAIAEQSISLLESGDETRAQRRVIRGDGQCVTRATTRSGGVADTLFYIFNFENNEGFSVVAANRNVSPLIAVTEQGNYTYGEPTGVEPFDDYMERATEYATRDIIIDLPDSLPAFPLNPTPQFRKDTVTREFERYGPYLQTKWGQTGLYGEECPYGIAGCCTAAVTQIMAYHNAPSSILITYEGSPYIGQTFGLNWSEILKHTQDESSPYAAYCSTYAHFAIPILFREVAERLDTRFDVDTNNDGVYDAASSTGNKVLNGLPTMGFTCSGLSLKKDDDSSGYNNVDTFKAILKQNIKDAKPVLMGGQDSENGRHMWVVDGHLYHEFVVYYYTHNSLLPGVDEDDGYSLTDTRDVTRDWLHINWGWKGTCNGYYLFDVFATLDAERYDDTSDLYGDRPDFNFEDGIIMITIND